VSEPTDTPGSETTDAPSAGDSATATPTVDEPSTEALMSDGPTIGVENVGALLRDVFGVFSGRTMEFDHDAAGVSAFTDEFDVDTWQAESLPERFNSGTLACENGGTVDFDFRSFFDGDGVFYDYAFDACQDGGRVLDGMLESDENAFGTRVTADGFRAVGQQGGTSSDGMVFFLWSARAPGGFPSRRMTDVDHTREEVGGTLAVKDANLFHVYGYGGDGVFHADLSGSFSLATAASGYRPVRVETPIGLRFADESGQADDTSAPLEFTQPLDGAWNYTSGTLTVTAEDGSALRIDADDDLASVTVLVSDPAGDDQVVTLPWAPFKAVLDFDPALLEQTVPTFDTQ